jgi:ABC-type antimicrobial peptide transport system permease subunit
LHCALNPATQEDLASTSLSRQRFLLLLFGTFAGLALLLASIGIYGVLAHLMGQRVPEFGLRMALGADARDVMGIVLRQNPRLVGAGLIIGILVALAVGRIL